MNTCAIALNTMNLACKLQDGDPRWSAFNGSFRNEWVVPQAFVEHICQGHAYTSWHSPCYRRSENWQMSQFLAADMDTEDARSTLEGLLENDFVTSFATVIHTTPSHTAEKPRARVVFFLDRPITQPQPYTVASKYLSWLLGGDKVATDPSRFFYGNDKAQYLVLRGHLPVDYFQTLFNRDKERFLLATDPAAKAKAIVTPATTHRTHRSDYSRRSDKWQEIEDALGRIDPWSIDYNEWLGILMALKFELGESALPLAVSWAQGKRGEVENKWRSFRREQGTLRTIATIMHHAPRA